MRVPLTTVGGEQAVFRMPPVIIIKQTMRRHTYLYLTVLPLLLLAAGCTKLQTEPTIQEGIDGSVIEPFFMEYEVDDPRRVTVFNDVLEQIPNSCCDIRVHLIFVVVGLWAS